MQPMLLQLLVLAGAAAAPTGAAPPIGAPCFPTAAAADILQETDLTGKVALVTGSSSGIGVEVARALALRKATVILTWRNRSLCEEVAANIANSMPAGHSGASLVVPDVPLDLSSFAVVRAFAKSLNATRFPALDILVNDAAMANNPHALTTVDKMEMAFEVDYPAPWLLTTLLLPQLRKAADGGRIVNLVSKAFRTACQMSERNDCMELGKLPPPVIPGDSPNASVPILNIPPTNYGIAKLLMVRWTADLARREAFAKTGVVAYSVDPGFVNTSMADKANMSPFFFKLACGSEGRPGAPCPTTGPQGALTPFFLAVAPERYLPTANSTGGFFEWCAPSKVTECIGGLQTMEHCQLASQPEQEALYNLTASWVADFLDPDGPGPEPEPPLPPAPATCPALLKPLCTLFNKTECFAQCSNQTNACAADKACRASLIKSMECFVRESVAGKMASAGLTCLVPDNQMRDTVFECMMDDHDCIPTPAGPTYPACRDAEIAGDVAHFTSLADLEGEWWKVRGWSAGEPYECRPCGRVAFGGHPAPDTLTITSSWLEKDVHGKLWTMNDSSLFGVRAGVSTGFPVKLAHTGVMLGLKYVENFTVVHDGRHDESEPFMFLYGCGETKQGAYTTGFAIAQSKTASAALSAKILAVAAANGFATDQWCVVDNNCTTGTATSTY